MVNQNKIILMTQMARYEKNQKNKDQKILDYFIEDYVYIHNFKTRLGITLITLCFIAFHAIKILIEGIIFPTSMWHLIEVYIKPYFWPWLIGIIVYTLISSVVYSRRYQAAHKRFKVYKRTIKNLEKYAKSYSQDEGVTDET